MPFTEEQLRKAAGAAVAHFERTGRHMNMRSSQRNIPGKIKREAPPGPEMTEAEFKVAMEQLAQDAARWRCLRLNWSSIMTEILEGHAPPSAVELQQCVDVRRGAKIPEPR